MNVFGIPDNKIKYFGRDILIVDIFGCRKNITVKKQTNANLTFLIIEKSQVRAGILAFYRCQSAVCLSSLPKLGCPYGDI